MPQLDFFNILAQIEYSVIVFFFLYLFNVFFVIPTVLTIFQLRTIFFNFPFQIINFLSATTSYFFSVNTEILKTNVSSVNELVPNLFLIQKFNDDLLFYLNEDYENFNDLFYLVIKFKKNVYI